MLGVFRKRKQLLSKGKVMFLPLDHGVSEGPLPGLERLDLFFPQLEQSALAA